MSTKTNALRKARTLGIDLQEGSGRNWDVTLWAPKGFIFDGSACGCFVIAWGTMPGRKAEFWDEVIDSMELAKVVKQTPHGVLARG